MKREDSAIQDEIIYAKQVQAETGCTWTEALKVSHRRIEQIRLTGLI